MHKNESNYCPRLVNWSVPDVKKLYFLFEAILHPLLPGSAVICRTKPASLAGGRCRRNALSTSSWRPCWPGLPARAGASKLSGSQPGNAVQPGPPFKILELAILREVENVPTLIRAFFIFKILKKRRRGERKCQFSFRLPQK